MREIYAALTTIVALPLVACGSQQADPGVTNTASALELPIIDCQTKQAACLIGAKSPLDAVGCNSALGQCLLDSAKQLTQLAQSVADCQTQAASCVQKGGVAAVAGCRKDFDACVSATADSDAGVASTAPGVPGLPGLPGLQAPNFPQLPGLTGAAGAGSLPGLPGAGSLPGLAGAGALPGLPQPPGLGCLDDLNKCVVGGSDPMDCANQARDCMRMQLQSGAVVH